MTPAIQSEPIRPAGITAAEIESSPVLKVGIILLSVYMLFMYGRVPEWLEAHIHSGLYVMPITLLGACALVTISGGLGRFLQQRAGLVLFAFEMWLIVVQPFSIWKSASVAMMLVYWRIATLTILLGGLVLTLKFYRRISMAIVMGMVVVLAVGFTTDMEDASRFALAEGSLSNPNEFACHLLIGFPLCVVMLTRKGIIRRLALSALALGCVALIVKTGSRAGLIIAALLLVMTFLGSSFMGKMKFLVAGTILTAVGVSLAPQSAIARYKTIFSSDVRTEATDSTAARHELLMGSLKVTMEHPIFGVGPANFVVAFNEGLVYRGMKVHWEATHNAYTEVSSETGIPGFILYTAALVLAMMAAFRIRRASKKDPRLKEFYILASGLILSIAAFMAAGMFGSIAHEFYFPVLVGLSIALTNAFNFHRQSLPNQPVAQYPAAIPGVAPSRFRPVAPRAPIPVFTRGSGSVTPVTRRLQ